jgi:hypothetical protein
MYGWRWAPDECVRVGAVWMHETGRVMLGARDKSGGDLGYELLTLSVEMP